MSILTWPQAIEKFEIPKMYQNVSLEKVNNKNPLLAKSAERWLKTKCRKSLYLYGCPGSGKTFFAYTLLKGLIDLKIYNWMLFGRSDEIDAELLAAVMEGQELTRLKKYSEVPFLFIDDFGVERLTDRVIKEFHNILDRRLTNYRPTVITSNLSSEAVKNTLGERISSRLQSAQQVKFPKKDLRKE